MLVCKDAELTRKPARPHSATEVPGVRRRRAFEHDTMSTSDGQVHARSARAGRPERM